MSDIRAIRDKFKEIAARYQLNSHAYIEFEQFLDGWEKKHQAMTETLVDVYLTELPDDDFWMDCVPPEVLTEIHRLAEARLRKAGK